MPFTKSDLAVITPGCNTNGTALLLSSINIIGKSIVGAHMIKLCSRLIVPGRKTFAAIYRDDSSLVARDKNDVGIIWIDPDAMIIISARRATKGFPILSAILRFPGYHISTVNYV